MKTIIKILCVLTLVFGLSSCGYERIDAGYEGIKVNLYGDGKGVDDVSLVTGAVWYNPVTTAVYEYPTFVQTVDYPPFSINAKDGSSFTNMVEYFGRENLEVIGNIYKNKELLNEKTT